MGEELTLLLAQSRRRLTKTAGAARRLPRAPVHPLGVAFEPPGARREVPTGQAVEPAWSSRTLLPSLFFFTTRLDFSSLAAGYFIFLVLPGLLAAGLLLFSSTRPFSFSLGQQAAEVGLGASARGAASRPAGRRAVTAPVGWRNRQAGAASASWRNRQAGATSTG